MCPGTTLSFVGAGRAASALAVAARAAGHSIAAVYSRTPKSAERLAALVGSRAVATPAAAAAAADLTLLTVPDSAVTATAATVAASDVALQGRVVAHTSASQDIEVIAALRITGAAIGSFHPLQALAGIESAPLLGGSYFAIDGDAGAREQLALLATSLQGTTISIPPESRAVYHAAAVLAGNAPLTLLAEAVRLLDGIGIDEQTAHQALSALLHGAATNAARATAASALTGPVVRGDAATVAAHLDALRDDPQAQQLYALLARQTALLAGRDPGQLLPSQADGVGPVIKRVA